jgi:hypothetical protein
MQRLNPYLNARSCANFGEYRLIHQVIGETDKWSNNPVLRGGQNSAYKYEDNMQGRSPKGRFCYIIDPTV